MYYLVQFFPHKFYLHPIHHLFQYDVKKIFLGKSMDGELPQSLDIWKCISTYLTNCLIRFEILHIRIVFSQLWEVCSDYKDIIPGTRLGGFEPSSTVASGGILHSSFSPSEARFSLFPTQQYLLYTSHGGHEQVTFLGFHVCRLTI